MGSSLEVTEQRAKQIDAALREFRDRFNIPVSDAEIAEVPFGAHGRLTVSIGVAEIRDDDDLASWLGRADQALYRAKRAGRNAVAAAEAN